MVFQEEIDMHSKAAIAARGGNKILDFISGTALLVLFLYGVYMVWYVIMVYMSAFLGDDILKFKPSGDDIHNPSLEELAAINPDVIGWITVDNTRIDYPIVQGKDNLEYLNLNVYREYSLAGTVFLDVNNEKHFSDPYNILYGHHMNHGLMFGQVLDFLDKDFFDEHETGTLYLLDATYSVEFFACVRANAYDARILAVNKDPEKMPAFLSFVKNNAECYREIPLKGNDKVISLVTCESSNTDGRAVLLGRLEQVETRSQGEDAEKKRESVRKQEWYVDTGE